MMRLVAGPKVGGSSINEKDSPILFLEPGITISNVIIGKPGAKGIWCKGSCTLQNVCQSLLLWLCNSKQISYICEAYKGTYDYSEISGTGPKPVLSEGIPVGYPLNGTTCKDPSAKIDILS
uniref:pectate lyase n=1 Tax=Ditylenchus dipsaci TaxID=166011 RepID=A0A915EIM0_9BILA